MRVKRIIRVTVSVATAHESDCNKD